MNMCLCVFECVPRFGEHRPTHVGELKRTTLAHYVAIERVQDALVRKLQRVIQDDTLLCLDRLNRIRCLPCIALPRLEQPLVLVPAPRKACAPKSARNCISAIAFRSCDPPGWTKLATLSHKVRGA